MKLMSKVTILVCAVMLLANAQKALAAAATSSNSASSQTQVKKASDVSYPQYGVEASISRSTSLVDFHDGTRSDGMDVTVKPSMKYSFGKFSAVFAYSQNLRDPYSTTENDFADIPVTFALPPKALGWFKSYKTSLGYSFTGVIPVSQLSTKRDNLQTALSAKVGLSFAAPDQQGFSLGTSVSLGRNFHSYEEDINGNVLNEYSSNQGLSLGYALENWSLSFDFVNKSRLTYQNSTKSAFEMTEELGYSINDNFGVAIGHTNAGSTLKDNGTDSNIDLVNENTSVVYGSLNLTY
ncbi:MAG: hypothetical protein ACXVAX_07900 [Pseudobdellovibrio sp.]